MQTWGSLVKVIVIIIFENESYEFILENCLGHKGDFKRNFVREKNQGFSFRLY